MDDADFFDLVKRTVVTGVFADDEFRDTLVLKGGNAVDLCYGNAMRASRDIDFSMAGEFPSLSYLEDKISKTLSTAFVEHGFQVFDVKVEDRPPQITPDMKDFWGGYHVSFKVASKDLWEKYGHDLEQMRRRASRILPDNSRAFEIDISRHEAINGKTKHYIDGSIIYAYSPAMIVAEKLRALCQCTSEYGKIVKRNHRPASRGRDFLDIYDLSERFNVRVESDEFRDILTKMFAIKRVPLSLLARIPSYKEHHRLDFDKLRDTVRPGFELLSFDAYFDSVSEQLKLLKSLWNK
jgi:predicted nucleotidyltransferase component of viral defense system